jgi:hypothetical protein
MWKCIVVLYDKLYESDVFRLFLKIERAIRFYLLYRFLNAIFRTYTRNLDALVFFLVIVMFKRRRQISIDTVRVRALRACITHYTNILSSFSLLIECITILMYFDGESKEMRVSWMSYERIYIYSRTTITIMYSVVHKSVQCFIIV